MSHWKTTLLYITAIVSILTIVPAITHGQTLNADPLGLNYGAESGLSAQDPRLSVVRIINFVLGLLGIIAVVLIIYAGFMWMTSAGNEDRIETAQQILWGAIIGLVIIFASYAITRFVVTNLYEATSEVPYGAP